MYKQASANFLLNYDVEVYVILTLLANFSGRGQRLSRIAFCSDDVSTCTRGVPTILSTHGL